MLLKIETRIHLSATRDGRTVERSMGVSGYTYEQIFEVAHASVEGPLTTDALCASNTPLWTFARRLRELEEEIRSELQSAELEDFDHQLNTMSQLGQFDRGPE